MDMGQYDLAHEQLQTALSSWKENHAPNHDQTLSALLSYYTLSEIGQPGEALAQLKMALKGSAQLGFDQFLVVAARNMLGLLKQADLGDLNPQLKELVKRAEGFKTGKAVVEIEADGVEIPRTHLEIRVLGSDSVRRDSELLPPSVWRSSRARALFYYIIDRGTVRKDDVGLDFWPDFSPGKISSNFHATLWRVRQALGGKDVIRFEDEVYSLHPSVTYWYDVAEFENYLTQAKQRKLTDTERVELLKQAIALYRGDYLADVYLEWADQRRDELQNAFLQALVSMAELEQKNSRFVEARALYERVLSIDPYRDKIHMALMDCLVQSGATSAAKAHFQDYVALLHRELNAQPLPELKAFYDRLST
jgi:DNA-binding SARP family transcriptional activator